MDSNDINNYGFKGRFFEKNQIASGQNYSFSGENWTPQNRHSQKNIIIRRYLIMFFLAFLPLALCLNIWAQEYPPKPAKTTSQPTEFSDVFDLNKGKVINELLDRFTKNQSTEDSSLLSPSANLIVNGSFETGNFAGWTITETSNVLIPWTVTTAGGGGSFGFPPTSPQDGIYSALNGFDGGTPLPAVQTLYQDVTIPASSTAILTWKDRISWNLRDFGAVGTQPRIFQVQIRNPTTNVVLSTVYSFSIPPETIQNGSWETHTANLSSFSGQNVRIYFIETVPENYTGPAQFEIDDVRLDSTAICSYSINPTGSNVTAAGGQFSFSITTTSDCSWTAQSNATWLTTTSSGTGNGTITYTVAANNMLSPRTGMIIVGGQTFTVTQQAFICTYSLSPNASNAPAAGGQFTFNVTTNSSICPVPVTSNADWLSTSTSNNGGTITIVYSVEPNTGTTPRTGTITVGDQTFTVTQAAAGCVYIIDPTSAPIGAGGGNGSFTINTTANCAWSAVSNVNWLAASGSGSGNGTISYTAAANTATSPRTGIITVGGQTFTLTQAAAPACTYSVSPTSQIVEAIAGTYSFNVFANPGCPWTATVVEPSITTWITTTSSGTGTGTANYTVTANPGAARQGRIMVNGQIFTVNQRNPVVTTFSISGQVTNGGIGLSGVRVILSGPDSREAITDSDGNYLFNNLAPANYTVTPSLAGAIIDPQVSPIPFLDSDRTANFTLDVCNYSLSAPGNNISSESFSGGFVVTGCSTIPWQAISNVSWIIVGNNGEGAGTQAVGYFVQRNYGAARSGTITVNGQIYTIVQDGFTVSANRNGSPQAETPQCIFQLAKDFANNDNLRRQTFSSNGGGSGLFNVKATNQGNLMNCAWEAVTGDSWIKIETPRGMNDQSVSFTVEENRNLQPRFGKISVDNEVYTVVQTANQAHCSYGLNPNRRNYPAGAGAGNEYSFNVEIFNTTPNLACRWRTFIDDMDEFTTNWLKIVGGANRIFTINASRNFTIEANEGTKTNEGTIVVGDKTFTITQDAGKREDCRWAFAAPGESVSVAGGTNRRINVLTGDGCNWTAVSNVSWIDVTGRVGTADGTASFNITRNDGTIARTGRVSIMEDPSVVYTITQAAPETCSYEIDPGFQRAANSGTTGTIKVTASSACGSQTRTAVSNNPEWITVTSGTTGSGSGMVSFIAQSNLLTTPRSGTITVAGRTFTVNQDAGNTTSSSRTNYDFDGDGRADISVFRPSNGAWYLNRSTSGFTGVQFGQDGDKLVAADYDGDGRTDVAVFRAGIWYLNRSTLGFTGVAFGESTDILVPADYDGDGSADLAVWRPSNGVWYIFNLATNEFTFAQFGAPTDKPVIGDFNGDGKSDFAVFRPSNGFWFIARPTGIPSQNFDSIQLGEANDKPVPADYDGDGRTDVAVFRPSNGVWYLQRSRDGLTGVQFGFSTDLPNPADYDGDGRADVAVFRSGTWFLQRSTQGFTGVQFGASTDNPVPNALVP